MANVVQTQQPKFSVALKTDAYQKLINDTLGDKEVARKFVAEISSVVGNNFQLQKVEAGSILSAGLLAQTLKLSLTPSLGLCYIVPYGDKAQFQVGYKGLIQLAMRSGVFEKLGVKEVHEGEYLGMDEDGEDLFKFSHEFDQKKVVGYRAYFKLLNGFRKSFYWTVAQVKAHATKYSKAFGTGKATDLWTNNFDMMAQKTVLKLLLNRYAPLSVEMELTTAIKADQAVINDDGTYEYVDNPNQPSNQKFSGGKAKNTAKKTTAVNTDDNGEVTDVIEDDNVLGETLFGN